jgi:hypothetical protein
MAYCTADIVTVILKDVAYIFPFYHWYACYFFSKLITLQRREVYRV